nr:cation:proton antiporter [Granulosicoccus sp.]
MDILTLSSMLLTVSALFAYVNYRLFKLPTTIGIMVVSLLFSVALVVLSRAGFSEGIVYAREVIGQIDFNQALMNGMLAWLLFAGALHVNLSELIDKRWIVGILASVGVITSTFIVGTGTYYILNALGFEISYIYCLLFGSLISPTDPVAVMGVLKTAGATKSLETKIAGESLFNDGVAIVVFLVIFGIAVHGDPISVPHIGGLFLQEAVGGAVFGFLIGWVVLQMLMRVDNYQVEVLLTLAL